MISMCYLACVSCKQSVFHLHGLLVLGKFNHASCLDEYLCLIQSSTVADVYAVHERGNALGIYFTGQFAGPLFGPIFGGFLVERWGWPSVFWLLFVIGCILLLLVVFTMEETYRDESIWGKEYDANKQFDPDEKSDNTVVADKMVNPLSALVS